MYDAIIIGAGPAGNMAALRLSEKGHKVAVIDPRHDIGNKLCTGIIGIDCAKKFPPQKTQIYSGASSATIVAPSGKTYTIEKDTPQAFIIDRVSYIKMIAEKASKAGAEYILGPRVESIHNTQSNTAVTLRGTKNKLLSRIAIVASGFGSSLIKQLGMQTESRDGYLAASQAEITSKNLDRTEIYLGSKIIHGSFGWVVPLVDGKALAGLIGPKVDKSQMDQFLCLLRSRNKVADITKNPTSWGVPIKPLSRTYGERILVAGDAAGLTKPTTGGGIYFSLISGELAAQTASEAIVIGDFSTKMMSGYQKSWEAVFGQELTIGHHARLLYQSLKDSQIDQLLDHLWTSGAKDELTNPLEFSFDQHSRAILKTINHRQISPLLKSFGPLAGPFIKRILGTTPK